MRLLRPRLRNPAQIVMLGAVAAIVGGLAQGWGIAVFALVFFLALAAVYYGWGGKDTDRGAIIGSRPDERQASMQMKVLALQGKVMSAAAAVTWLVVSLGKTTWWPKVNVWPFFVPLAVASLTGLAGWVIYRERGGGDEVSGAHADQGGPRIPVRHL